MKQFKTKKNFLTLIRKSTEVRITLLSKSPVGWFPLIDKDELIGLDEQQIKRLQYSFVRPFLKDKIRILYIEERQSINNNN